MSTKMPPVPPANRSPKGPGSDPAMAKDTTPQGQMRPSDPEQQDQEGNTRQNTTHQGSARRSERACVTVAHPRCTTPDRPAARGRPQARAQPTRSAQAGGATSNRMSTMTARPFAAFALLAGALSAVPDAASAQQLENSLSGTIRIPFSAPSRPGNVIEPGYDSGGNRVNRYGGVGYDLRRTSPSVGGSLDLSNSSVYVPTQRLPGDLR